MYNVRELNPKRSSLRANLPDERYKRKKTSSFGKFEQIMTKKPIII